MMKSLMAAGAVLITGVLATAPRAEAGIEFSVGWGQTYVSGRASCGCPIYSERVCCGYDHYRRPIFTIRPKPFHCGCKDHGKRDKEARKYYEKQEKERREYEKKMEKLHKKYHKH